MSSFAIPSVQWVQQLKNSLFNLLFSCQTKYTYFHSHKFAEIAQTLDNLYKSINSTPALKKPLNAEKINIILELISKFKALNEFIISYNKENCLETTMKYKVETVVQTLTKFRKEYNLICTKLQFPPDFYFPKEQALFVKNDYEDCQKIMNELKKILEKSDKLTESNKSILRERVSEVQTIISERHNSPFSAERIVPQSVINDELKEYLPWDLPEDDFTICSEIGRGGFSMVYYAHRKSNDTYVALKSVNSLYITAQQLELFKREVHAFTTYNHPCILPFIGICISKLFIVTEYMSGHSLYQRIHNKELPILTPTDKTIIALGIAYGMRFLHEKKFIHRDLKSLNILLDSNSFPKISDFGLSRQHNDQDVMTIGVGTNFWMAPEVKHSDHYDSKVDVYSFGKILLELLTNEIIEDENPLNNDHSIIPKNCNPNLYKLIRDCCEREPDKRPDFKKIVSDIENGEVMFDGTDKNKVNEYSQMIIKLEDKKLLITNLLSNINEENQNVIITKIFKFDAKNIVLSLQDNMNILYNLRQNKEFISLFMKSDRNEIILDLLLATEDKRIIEILFSFSSNINPKLIYKLEHFQKLSQFLVSKGRNSRKNTILLLQKIIVNEQYDSIDDVLTTIPDLLSQFALFPDIILSTLEMMKLFPSFPLSIEESNGLITLVYNLNRSNEENDYQILLLCQFLLKSIQPSVEFLDNLFSILGILLDKSESIKIETLKILMQIFQINESFPIFAKIKENPFKSILRSKSEQSIIFTLHLSHVLLMQPSTFSLMSTLSKHFVSLLNHNNNEISKIAIACLTLLPADLILNDDNNENLIKFFNNSFSKESEITQFAIRLAGIICSKSEGAKFIQKYERELFEFLKTENKQIKKFTVMVFASLSSRNQFSKIYEDCLPVMLRLMRDDEVSNYVFVYLSNITMNPNAAKLCAPFISDLLQILNEGNFKSFPIIRRIATTIECLPLLINHVERIIETISPFLNSGIESLILEIYESLSTFEEGKAALKKMVYSSFESHLNDLQYDDPIKPQYIRILSRLQ